MKYFLIKEHQTFFDSRGSGDDGETRKFVTTDERYLLLGDSYYFDNNIINYLEENMSEKDIIEYLKDEASDEDNLAGQDGYNCEVYTFDIKEISESEYNEYQKVIDNYNKI